mgnify:CR=1 FL=1
MKALILIPLLILAGCSTSKPQSEGKLVGTMSIYKTDRGFIVQSDQSGEKMLFELHIGRTIVLAK